MATEQTEALRKQCKRQQPTWSNGATEHETGTRLCTKEAGSSRRPETQENDIRMPLGRERKLSASGLCPARAYRAPPQILPAPLHALRESPPGRSTFCGVSPSQLVALAHLAPPNSARRARWLWHKTDVVWSANPTASRCAVVRHARLVRRGQCVRSEHLRSTFQLSARSRSDSDWSRKMLAAQSCRLLACHCPGPPFCSTCPSLRYHR